MVVNGEDNFSGVLDFYPSVDAGEETTETWLAAIGGENELIMVRLNRKQGIFLSFSFS